MAPVVTSAEIGRPAAEVFAYATDLACCFLFLGQRHGRVRGACGTGLYGRCAGLAGGQCGGASFGSPAGPG